MSEAAWYSKILESSRNVEVFNYSTGAFEELPEAFLDKLSEARKFVLHLGEPFSSEELETAKRLKSPFNSPFDLCWFEFFFPASIHAEGRNHHAYQVGGLIDQRGSNDDLSILTITDPGRSDERTFFVDFPKWTGAYQLFSQYINRALKGFACEVKINQKIKQRREHDVKIHRIRKVVYLSPKNVDTRCLITGKKLEWSHRWEVRGHWRNCRGVGKDRHGEYNVYGRTWVIPHEKGAIAPLVKKTRVTKPSSSVDIPPPVG